MAKKAELIAQLTKYDSVDKGWARRNLYGDNEYVQHLRGVLALPHIKALPDDAEISLLIELWRLDLSYDRVFTSNFFNGSSSHISYQLFYSIIPSEPSLSIFDYTPITVTLPTHKKIENVLEVLRDKLIFYITCVSSQPKFTLFAAEYLASGGSGFSGLLRANKLLLEVQSALAQYKKTGGLSPLISKIRSINLGAHMRDLIEPTLATFMDIIKDHFRIKTEFTNTFYTTSLFDEKITANRLHCHIEIADRKMVSQSIDCYFTEDMFQVFLEEYLIKNKFSFTEPSPHPFSSDDFNEVFGNYLIKLQDYEQLSIISSAN